MSTQFCYHWNCASSHKICSISWKYAFLSSLYSWVSKIQGRCNFTESSKLWEDGTLLFKTRRTPTLWSRTWLLKKTGLKIAPVSWRFCVNHCIIFHSALNTSLIIINVRLMAYMIITSRHKDRHFFGFSCGVLDLAFDIFADFIMA